MKKLCLLLVGFFFCSVSFSETYSHFFSVSRDSSGNVLVDATVVVYLSGTTTSASIYSDSSGTVKSNPFLTDAQGNYDFFVTPGLYKIVLTKSGVGTFTTDEISIGTQIHASSHLSGGSDQFAVTTNEITNNTISNIDISNSAAIVESKLSLNFPTHSNVNDPITDQKAALAGTAGAPGAGNKYVTNIDSRLTNSRTPTPHSSTHESLGSDPVSLVLSQLTGVNLGTDLSSDLEEEIHSTEHQNGGTDEISVSGLSGELSDLQKIEMLVNGTSIGIKTKVNFVDGSNVLINGVDNTVDGRVDITVASPGNNEIAVFEGVTQKTSPTDQLTFGSGFDITAVANDAQIGLDLSEIVVDANKLNGITSDLTGVTNGQLLGYNGTTISPFTPDPNGIIVQEDTIETQANSLGLNFGSGISTAGGTGGVTDVDLELSEIVVNAQLLQNHEIDTTAPTNGQILKWNSTTSKWVPSIFSFNAPADGQVLKWDNVNSRWNAATDAAGGTITTYESGTTITAVTDAFDFQNGFDLTATGGTKANINLDLSEITVNADDSDKLVGLPFNPSFATVGAGEGAVFIWNSAVPEFQISFPYLKVKYWQFGNWLGTLTTSLGGIDLSVTNDLIAGGPVGVGYQYMPLSINFGTDEHQVNLDDIPNGLTYSKLTGAQVTDLTDSGDSALHYHSSDRNLANATGILDGVANEINAAAIKAGTIDNARLGNVKIQTKSIVIPYPTTNKFYGQIFFPNAVTVTKLAARSKVANCSVNSYISGGSAIVDADLVATTTGSVTSTILTPSVPSDSWIEFWVGPSCPNTVTEVSITLVYTVN